MRESLGDALAAVFGNASMLVMVALASATVHASAVRAAFDVKPPAGAGAGAGRAAAAATPPAGEPARLADKLALAVPFVAAAMLLVMFFFKDWIGPLLVLAAACVSFVSVPFSVRPLVVHVLARCGAAFAANFVSFAFAAAVVVAWLFSGHWILNNIIAASLCVVMLSMVRVPSLRVVSMLLCGLVVYDVLMVFVSPYILSRNVMVEVATQEPQNPASVVSEALHIPLGAVKKLSFPGKFVVPSFGSNAADDSYSLLGLGDCMIPGLLLVYLRSFEAFTGDAQRKRPVSYYPFTLLAYVFALFLTFFISVVWGAAQPALLYIVPLTLGTSAACATKNDEWPLLWNGPANLVAENLFDLTDGDERAPLSGSIL